MKTMTLMIPGAPSMHVALGESRYGTARPQIELRFARGTHRRVVRAATLMVAGHLEMITPGQEQWNVYPGETGEEPRALVYLELAEGDGEEMTRALALLRGFAEAG